MVPAGLSKQVSIDCRGWSIRALFHLLIFAAVLSLIALLSYSTYKGYVIDRKQPVRFALSLVRITSENVDAFLDDTRQTMARLAARPRVRNMEAKDCDCIFSKFGDHFPQFANFSQANFDGKLICSTSRQPDGKQTAVGDTLWFKRVMSENKSIVVPPFGGPVGKK